jgi:hypothetical protein
MALNARKFGAPEIRIVSNRGYWIGVDGAPKGWTGAAAVMFW